MDLDLQNVARFSKEHGFHYSLKLNAPFSSIYSDESLRITTPSITSAKEFSQELSQYFGKTFKTIVQPLGSKANIWVLKPIKIGSSSMNPRKAFELALEREKLAKSVTDADELVRVLDATDDFLDRESFTKDQINLYTLNLNTAIDHCLNLETRLKKVAQVIKEVIKQLELLNFVDAKNIERECWKVQNTVGDIKDILRKGGIF